MTMSAIGFAAARGHAVLSRERALAFWRAVPGSLTVVIAVLAAAESSVLLGMRPGRDLWLVDVTHYLRATRRWLEFGTPYLADEVARPFAFGLETFLHPPGALLLFLPFTVLPVVLWWVIPTGILVLSIRAWRPDRWTWPIIALCLLWPRTQTALMYGNTDMWIAAFVALGLRFGWPGLLVMVKPSFAPLMLIGSRSRSWWLALLPIAIAASLFGQLWLDWLAVIRHAPADWTYSLTSLPMIAIPVVAWLRRRRQPASRWRSESAASSPYQDDLGTRSVLDKAEERDPRAALRIG
jgi:hypothetical protein